MKTLLTLLAALIAAFVLVSTAALAQPAGIEAHPAQAQRQQGTVAGESPQSIHLRALAACLADRAYSVK